MMRIFLVVLSGVVLAAGCSSEKPAEPVVSIPAREESKDAEVEAALAEFSAEDREAALAQNLCPVSGQELGSMGTPIKVTVEGRDVFVCCAGCIDELKNNFARYQSKLAH